MKRRDFTADALKVLIGVLGWPRIPGWSIAPLESTKPPCYDFEFEAT